MSASQNTTNYGFPKFLGTDKPAWLVDFNGAMDDIDTTIKTVVDVLTTLDGTVQTNTGDISQLITDLETANGIIATKSPIENPNFLGNITLNGVALANIMYPVGSIYISTIASNPSLFFGGIWAAFGAGRTLVGFDSTQTEFDTVEETGGEKTHLLTVAEMPAHGHGISSPLGQSLTSLFGSSVGTSGQGINDGNSQNPYKAENAGGGQAHNNLQPYIVTYMWKRIS